MGARGSRAPCLSLCLGFPQGWSRRGPRRIWGAPRSPALFLPEDPERDPGGFRGAPSPRTNLAGRRTWRARRGGSASAAPQLLPPGTPGSVASFPLYLSPQSAQKGESQTQLAGQGGAGGGVPVGGPRRVHHSLSAPEPATVFILMEPLPAQPHLSPQGCL